MTAKGQLQADNLKENLNGRWPEVIVALAPALSGALQLLKKPQACPKCGGSDRFNFDKNFIDNGAAWCRKCDLKCRDGIELLVRFNGWDFKYTLSQLALFLGEVPRPIENSQPKSKPTKKNIDFVKKAWAESKAADITLHISEYLKFRGLSGEVPATIRFHPALYHKDENSNVHYEPALVARIQNLKGDLLSLQRIYLADQCHGKSKNLPNKMIMPVSGNISGGAVCFGSPTSYICIAEGIETALAVLEMTGQPTWAGISSTLMKSMELPETVKDVWIFADKDKAGREAAEALAKKHTLLGRKCYIRYPASDGDWLDEYVAKGKEALAFDGELKPFELPDDEDIITLTEDTFDDWPNPEPLYKLPPVEPFDNGMLPAPFKKYVEDCAKRMCTAPDYIAIALMSSLGAVIGAKLAVRPKKNDFGWYEYPNLWSLGIGRPGAMKSPSMAAGYVGIQKLAGDAIEKYKEELEKYRKEELAFKMQKKLFEDEIKKEFKAKNHHKANKLTQELINMTPVPPIEKRYILNDSTPERLITLQEHNENGLMLRRDEMIGIFAVFNKLGYETAKAIFNSGFDGKDSHTVDRQGARVIHCKRNMLTISGTIQPGPLNVQLQESLQGMAGADGFCQRLQMMVWPDIDTQYEYVDDDPNTALEDQIINIFEKIDKIDGHRNYVDLKKQNPGGFPLLGFDDNAQAMFADWLINLEKKLRSGEMSETLEGHFSKYKKLVPALSLLIHIVDFGLTPINIVSFNKALMWEKYLRSHALRVYSMQKDSSVLVSHLISKKLLKGELRDGFTARDIYYKNENQIGRSAEVKDGLKVLCDLDWLRSALIETGGKPKITFVVNPKIMQMGTK